MRKAITIIHPILAVFTGLFSQPVDFQLFQRDPGTGNCRVSCPAPSATAQLKVYAGGQLQETITEIANGSLTAGIEAGLVEYKFELVNGGNVVETADGVACGDTYIIYGQSNATANYGAENYEYRNDFLRTYTGSWRPAGPGRGNVGVWGMHLARQILEKHGMPVCVINGARNNTAVRHLVRGAVYDPGSSVKGEADFYKETTEWGNFYKRMQAWVEEAGLTPGIRALLWHQGERQIYGEGEEPARYYDEFKTLRDQLYEDYGGLEKIFMFQIRNGCGGGVPFNVLNENIRKLAADHPDIEVMTPLSNDVAGCHYGEANTKGYEIIAEDMFPLVDTTFYGAVYDRPVGAPNLLQAAWTSAAKDEIVMQFDQDVTWNARLEFEPGNLTHEWNRSAAHRGSEVFPKYLKDIWSFDAVPNPSDKVVSGRSEGRYAYLELAGSSGFSKLAYPSGKMHGIWPGPYITGTYNGTGALGFYVDIRNQLGEVSGCMDSNYLEYDPKATVDDPSACRTKIVRGCTDPAYLEYNPDANVHDSAACVTLEANPGNAPGNTLFFETRDLITIIVNLSGRHEVLLWDIEGNSIGRLSGSERTEYRLTKNTLPVGVCLIEVKGDNLEVMRRVFNLR